MIFLGNFQLRGPVKGEFEVDSERHFLLSRSRDKNIHFFEDCLPNFSRGFAFVAERATTHRLQGSS